MSKAIRALVALILLGGAAYAGWGLYTGQFQLPDMPQAGQTGTTAATPPPVTAAAPDTAVETLPARQATRGPAPETVPGFAFRRLEIDTDGEAPEACLVFTGKLDPSGETRYRDYLAIDPAIVPALRVTEDRLCLGGLAFAQTYSVEIRKGLPGADGTATGAAETIAVELRDRPATVRFGGGLILPRGNADGVPVTTVNVAEIDVEVIRVSDRLLTQLREGVVDETRLYGWDRMEMRDQMGALVWSGVMQTGGARNAVVNTLFPLREAIGAAGPGVYLITAKERKPGAELGEAEDFDWSERAAQWVIDTDLALTTFTGRDGLSVFVRGLADAQAQSGVRLALVARNNVVLAEGVSDAMGAVRFDAGLMRGTGGSQPVVVMAYTDAGDFTYLDLRRPAFDLTDRGVSGRAAPGASDAWLYTDRGIYRPGETVELVAMLRDATANAITGAPLTIVVNRPDGQEYRRFVAGETQAGAAHVALALTPGAPRGRWQAAAYLDPTAAPVGRVQFDVQDFVPQRLQLTLSPDQERYESGDTVSVAVEGRFLYGAPAAGIGGEGEARLVANPSPFRDHPGFRFGRVEERFEDQILGLDVPATDAAGRTTASLTLPDLTATSFPLTAKLRISLFEPGGRLTSDMVDVAVFPKPVLIGIRPGFEFDTVRENTPAAFEAGVFDPTGARLSAEGLTWELVREDSYHNWFQVEGQWRFERTVRDRIVAGGTLDAAADGDFAKLAEAAPWGAYRLTISDPASGASASLRYWSGWGAGASGDRPDRMAVIAERETYAPGETAKLTLRPNTDGKALVVVAGERIFEQRLIDAPADGAEIEIPVSAEWGSGAYVLVTHYRPLDSAMARAPVRAIGVAWLGVDQSDRTLSVSIGAPEVARPRGPVEVALEVGNLEPGASAFVTLAAVDEGVLQLTDFKSPDPGAWYFAKKRLGLDMRDDYGRLIEVERTMVGAIRSGGDAIGGRGLSVVPQRVVALFSGIVALDAAGKATVGFDLPDFNGEIRLMAVAWTAERMGAASEPMTVRDTVVGEITLPRFLAPGDAAAALLSLHNVEGAPGDYTANVGAGGSVSTSMAAVTRTLEAGQRVEIAVPLTAGIAGIGTVTLSMTGPDGFAVERAWPIEVRPAALEVSSAATVALAPGESFSVGADLLAPFAPGTGAVAVSVSPARAFGGVAGLMRWLDRYPYGCLEQTTSRAMPLVLFNELAPMAGLARDEALRERVQAAVDRVFDMQTFAGNFGMWSSGDEAQAWLSLYALDFIAMAREQNYVVPREGLRRGLLWARDTSGQDWHGDAVRAYAFYVLAREGAADLSALRYFADQRMAQMSDGLAAAMTAAALAESGDRARAIAMMARAGDIVRSARPLTYVAADYGSMLRDVAGATALAAEAGIEDQLVPLIDLAVSFDPAINMTTTQEKAWMLRAAYALQKQAGPLNLEVTGIAAAPAEGQLAFAPDAAALEQGVSVRNAGQTTVWRTVSVSGVPAEPLPADAAGMAIEKTYWTLDGAPADLSAVRQNDRILVRITGQMENNLFRQMVVADLLPAGFEIETVLTGEMGKLYPVIGEATYAQVAEARDDRFVAAFTIGSTFRQPRRANEPEPQPRFTLGYIARATVAGSFVLPAANAEDMYAPSVFARTEAGSLAIAPAAQ